MFLFRFLTKGGIPILASWLSEAALEEQTTLLLVLLKVSMSSYNGLCNQILLVIFSFLYCVTGFYPHVVHKLFIVVNRFYATCLCIKCCQYRCRASCKQLTNCDFIIGHQVCMCLVQRPSHQCFSYFFSIGW